MARPAWSDAPQQAARTLFREALLQADRGDHIAALRDFESAYRIQPHFSVLYNIAQTHALLGRPVEAVAVFKRYLEDGGDQIGKGRKTEVLALIAANTGRIGYLRFREISSEPATAWLDGTELPATTRAAPVPVSAGEHTLIYYYGAGPARTLKVSAIAQETVELQLAPIRPSSPGSSLAQLRVVCPVPGVSVAVDGERRATTPVAEPLLLPAGEREVSFTRAGYVPVRRNVVLQQELVQLVQCEQRVDPQISPLQSGQFSISTQPTHARVTLDGSPNASGTIPTGTHHLVVEHEGFKPQQRWFTIRAGESRHETVTLEPTSESLAAQARDRSRRRAIGFTVGGLGLALLASSAGVYAWNSKRYSRWESAMTPARAADVQRGDDVTVGLAIAGFAFVSAGAWSVGR